MTNAMQMCIYPFELIVKVDDTLPGITAGLNAGMWTVGITQTGNKIDLNQAQIAATTPARSKRYPRTKQSLLPHEAIAPTAQSNCYCRTKQSLLPHEATATTARSNCYYRMKQSLLPHKAIAPPARNNRYYRTKQPLLPHEATATRPRSNERKQCTSQQCKGPCLAGHALIVWRVLLRLLGLSGPVGQGSTIVTLLYAQQTLCCAYPTDRFVGVLPLY